jgi:hypothetical protein
MHDDVVMELGVLTVFLLLKLPKHAELLEGYVKESAINSCRVVSDIFDSRCLHSNLVDLLEQDPQELRDQTPTGCLGGCRLRGGSTFTQDVTVKAIDLCVTKIALKCIMHSPCSSVRIVSASREPIDWEMAPLMRSKALLTA